MRFVCTLEKDLKLPRGVVNRNEDFFINSLFGLLSGLRSPPQPDFFFYSFFSYI